MSKIKVTESDVEVLGYIANTDKEKNYVGIITARVLDLFFARYKIVKKTNAEGYYLRISCYEITQEENDPQYLDSFGMERNSDEEIIQNVLRNWYKQNILSASIKAIKADPIGF